ncbi:hypothetical protein HDV06_003732, partial [Boothiomyces sp. JEL0866]
MSSWSLNNAFEFVKSAVDSVESQLDSILDQEKKPKPTSDVFKKSKHLSKGKQSSTEQKSKTPLDNSTISSVENQSGEKPLVEKSSIGQQSQPETELFSSESQAKQSSMKEGWGSVEDFEIEDALDEIEPKVESTAEPANQVKSKLPISNNITEAKAAITKDVPEAKKELSKDIQAGEQEIIPAVCNVTELQTTETEKNINDTVDDIKVEDGSTPDKVLLNESQENVITGVKEEKPDEKETSTEGQAFPTKVSETDSGILKKDLEMKDSNVKAVPSDVQEEASIFASDEASILKSKSEELEKRNLQLLEAKIENAQLYDRIQQLEQELAQKQSNYEILNDRYIKYKEKQDNEIDSNFTDMQNALDLKEEKIAG